MNFDLKKKLVRFIGVFGMQALHKKQFKTTAGNKKLKTVGYITPTMDHYPRIDRREILIPRSDM